MAMHEANRTLTDATVEHLCILVSVIIDGRQAAPAACSLLDLVSLLASFASPTDQRLIATHAVDVLVVHTMH
jgi:hypothetical protein